MRSAGALIEQRPLGGANITVSSVGLGTAAIALPYGAPGQARRPPRRSAARRTIELALEAGITLIDTAPAYGEAEEIVGEVVAGGARCVIATKLATPRQGWDSLSPGEARSAVRRSVGRSLERLRRERVELVQVHNADRGLVSRGDVADALEELRSEGALDAIGATVYDEGDAIAVVGSGRFDSVQLPYSALDSRADRRVLPMAMEAGVAAIARSVLLRGVLSAAALALGPGFARLRDAADRFRREIGATWEDLPAAALAFVLTRPGISSALVGPRDPVELRGLISGAAGFMKAARKLTDLRLDLPDDLLDPRAWEGL